MSGTLSPLFDEALWREVSGFEDLTDVTYHQDEAHSMARVAFNRPEVRNAFRPHTVDELYRVLDHARLVPTLGAVILTGNGPSPKDGGWSFSSGGDQRIRGKDGYQYSSTEDAGGVDSARADCVHENSIGADFTGEGFSEADESRAEYVGQKEAVDRLLGGD